MRQVIQTRKIIGYKQKSEKKLREGKEIIPKLSIRGLQWAVPQINQTALFWQSDECLAKETRPTL